MQQINLSELKWNDPKYFFFTVEVFMHWKYRK